MTGQRLTNLALVTVPAALVFLSGCAGAPIVPEHRYLLGFTSQSAAPAVSSEHRLWIALPRLAPFLRSDGIVMQINDVAIHQGRDHLWAEDLAIQLRRSLREELARKLPRVQVLDDSESAATGEPPHRLEVDVDGFQGRYDGVAVVVGQWRLRDGTGRLLAARQFSVERPLPADGYQALVESLAAAWRGVADEIAPVVGSKLIAADH
ncbi:MAG: membrane integrity-associated transporter subunit PqiC [Nitrococcus mobilis]|nr:membrane integrity-associated transporter subunit PqiC [Nitrococcus mobilis]